MKRARLTYACRRCGLIFIGDRAVHHWTDHTWTHVEVRA